MGRARRKHGGGCNEERDATTRYRQGTGPPVKAGRGGGGVRLMESGRVRKVPLDCITLGLTSTCAQVEDGKGVQPDGVPQARLARGTPLGRLAWEGSADERWRRSVSIAVQVDGCSATGQEREEKKRV